MPMNKPHLEFTRVDMKHGLGHAARLSRRHQAEDPRERHRRDAQDGKPHAAAALRARAPTRPRRSCTTIGKRSISCRATSSSATTQEGKGGEAVQGADLCVPAARRLSRPVQIRTRLPAVRDPLLRREQEVATMLATRDMLAPKLSSRRPYLAARAFRRPAPTRRATSSSAASPTLAALGAARSAPSCISTSTARAWRPTQSTARWRDGKPLSPIDGMPIGIKDIIETIDMPTENGSPLFAGWRSERDAASVAALREAGAVIVGKTVTTEFAATEPRGTRNPHDLEPHARRLEQRLGRGGRGRHAQRRARHAGDRLDHPTGELLRLRRLQGDGRRAQSRRQPRRPEPELHRRARGDAGGCLAGRLRDRACAPAAIPAIPGLVRPGERAGAGEAAPARLPGDRGLGRRVAGRQGRRWPTRWRGSRPPASTVADAPIDDAKVAAVETAIADARPLSMRDQRLGSRAGRSTPTASATPSKLSRVMLAAPRRGRGHDARRLSRRARAARRRRARSMPSSRRSATPASASPRPAAAPVGLQSTGDPSCTVHASLLGIPAISLPVLQDDGLPLGLQVTGFVHGDAEAFAAAGCAIRALL